MKRTEIHRNRPVGRWGICLLLALTVSSCTEQDERADGATPTPLQVGNASVGAGLSTRADEGNRTLNNEADRMGIFVQEQTGVYRAVNNRQFTYATPFWQTDEQLLLVGTPGTLAAYYPYNAEHGQNPILMRSCEYKVTEDLSYSVFNASNANPRANLTLNHAYARLKFSFAPSKEGQNYEGAGAITRMVVNGQGIRSVARLDLFQANGVAGSITDLPGVLPGVDIPLSGISFVDGPGKAVTDFLFIPGALTGDVTFTATIDGKAMQGTIPATTLCGTGSALLYGRVYQVNVTVKPSALLVIDEVKITVGWDDYPGGDISGDIK